MMVKLTLYKHLINTQGVCWNKYGMRSLFDLTSNNSACCRGKFRQIVLFINSDKQCNYGLLGVVIISIKGGNLTARNQTVSRDDEGRHDYHEYLFYRFVSFILTIQR